MKVQIRRFAELRNIEFETPIEISGANKLGKTSILNAVSWCLFGKNIEGDDMGVSIYSSGDDDDEKCANVCVEYNGHTIERIAKPTFSKSGEIKSRVSTTINFDGNKVGEKEYETTMGFTIFNGTRKLSIDMLCVNPLLFLNLDYKDKKTILNTIAVKDDDELGSFDLAGKIAKRKLLKKQINENEKNIELEKAKIDEYVSVNEVVIPDELYRAKLEYDSINKVTDKELIARINNENNLLLVERQKKEANMRSLIERAKADAENIRSEIVAIENASFVPTICPYHEVDNTANNDLMENAKKEWENSVRYEDIKTFFAERQDFINSNKRNVKSIIRNIQTLKNAKFDENTDKALCPITNLACETAKTDAKKSWELANASALDAEKERFQRTLHLIMDEYNAENDKKQLEYEVAKSKFDEIEKANIEARIKINEFALKNEQAEKEFTAQKDVDKAKKTAELEKINSKIESLSTDLDLFLNEEIKLKELPIAQTIDAELEEKANKYEELATKKLQNDAVNAEFAKKRDNCKANIQTYRQHNIELYNELTSVQSSIWEYMRKIQDKLKNIFDGLYNLRFEFFSETIDGEIDDDCCNIYADERLYLNEATTVNVGLQILKGLQTFFNKKYVILLDRSESVNRIDNYGMDMINTKVTNDNKLSFTNK